MYLATFNNPRARRSKYWAWIILYLEIEAFYLRKDLKSKTREEFEAMAKRSDMPLISD